jgi:hypothetical protein
MFVFVLVLLALITACAAPPSPPTTSSVTTQQGYWHWHWKGSYEKPLQGGMVAVMTLEGDRDEDVKEPYCPVPEGYTQKSCEKTNIVRRSGAPPTATPVLALKGPVTLKTPIPITKIPAYCQGLQLPSLAKSETQEAGPELDVQILSYSANGDPFLELKRQAQDASKMVVAEIYVHSNLQKPIYLTLDPMVFAIPAREKVCVRTYFVRPGRTPMPGGVEKVVYVPTSLSKLIGFVVPENQ